MRTIIMTIIFFHAALVSSSQLVDSVLHSGTGKSGSKVINPGNRENKVTTFFIPAACIAYGAANIGKYGSLNIDRPVQRLTQHSLNLHHLDIDNSLQYAPIAALYLMDALKVKPIHNIRTRSKIFTIGTLIVFTGVSITKAAVSVQRPDKTNKRSFPSGHTATAFFGADFFYQEYKFKKKWWIYSGYVMAGFVGTCRIINNKHWLSDVVAGAGFGILSNRLSYLIFDSKNLYRK